MPENSIYACLCIAGRELTVSSGGKARTLSYLLHLGRVVCFLVCCSFLTLLHFEENCDSKIIVTGFPKCASEPRELDTKLFLFFFF